MTRFVVGRGDAETAADGTFSLDLPGGISATDDLFVEVELPDPNVQGGSGSWYIRQRVQAVDGVDQAYRPITFDLTSRVRACSGTTCGAPLLPDLVQLVEGDAPSPDRPYPADSWSIDTDTMPGRQLLRFASAIANRGDGPLHIIAVERTEAGMVTVQRIWTSSQAYRDEAAGTFVFHEGHDHMHLDGFEEYRLLDARGDQVAEANKVSFCLTDSWSIDDIALPEGVFPSAMCGDVEQAINVGSADYYEAGLDDQWIDVTDVDPGTYRVQLIVDPDNIIEELDESNNVAEFEVVLPG